MAISSVLQIESWDQDSNICPNATTKSKKAFTPYLVLHDPPYEAPGGRPDAGKMHRLAIFRDHFRNTLRSKFEATPAIAPDVVVLVDGDLFSMPAAASIERAAGKVLRGEWQALCANGRAGHHWHERYVMLFRRTQPSTV